MRLRLAVVVPIVAVAGVSAWLWLRPSSADLMAEFVAELRARGEPVTMADLEPAMPRDADNGAHDLTRGFRWLEARLAQEDRELDPDGPHSRWQYRYVGPWNPDMDEHWATEAAAEQLGEVREFLSTLDPFFDAAEMAVGKREIAWPLPGAASSSSFFGPNGLGSMDTWKNAVRLLEAQAVVAESESDRSAAIECVLGLPALTRLRTHSDHVYGAYHRRLACIALRDGVEAGRLSGDVLRARVDRLLRGGSVASMPRALRTSRTAFIDQYPALCDGSLQRQLRPALRTIDTLVNERPPPSALEDFGHSVGDAIVGLRFDPAAYLEALREFDDLIPDQGAWDDDAESALMAVEQGSGYLRDGAVMQLVNSRRAADAAEGLARLALAACEHLRLHGDWPQTPADLAPQFSDGVPVDPYSGGPFVITRDGAVLVLRASRPDSARTRPDESLRDAGLEWRLPPR